MKIFDNKPSSIFQKYKKYLELYHRFYSIDITDKNYDTTLIRWLIIFFLYRENEIGNKFTMQEIAQIFDLKHKTTITHSNNKIKEFIAFPNRIKRVVSGSKTRFFYFYYMYNKIFSEIK